MQNKTINSRIVSIESNYPQFIIFNLIIMETTTIWVIVFYLLLIDSLSANIVSWLGFRKWYQGNFGIIARHFPITRGWTTYYLVLVLIIGYLLHNFATPLF